MQLNNRFIFRTALTLMGCLSCSAFAEEKQVSESIMPSFLLEISGGDGADHAELAVGLEPKDQLGSFAGLYIAKSSLGDHGTVKELGVKALNFTEASKALYGAEMHLGFSKTTLAQYERRGFEIGVNLYDFFTESLSMYFGASLRPRLLSLDWSNKELFEVSSNIGLNYQLPYNINIFTQYQYDNFIKNNWRTSKIDGQVMIGANWLY